MKEVKTFVVDFINFFISILFSVLVVVTEIVFQIYTSLSKLWNNVVKPMIVELLADFNMFLNIVLQGFFEVSSNMFLFLSKITLNWSQYFHGKSEEYINKNWNV